jgi:glyceraldehyde 3-phosphate dehydrogenase
VGSPFSSEAHIFIVPSVSEISLEKQVVRAGQHRGNNRFLGASRANIAAAWSMKTAISNLFLSQTNQACNSQMICTARCLQWSIRKGKPTGKENLTAKDFSLARHESMSFHLKARDRSVIIMGLVEFDFGPMSNTAPTPAFKPASPITKEKRQMAVKVGINGFGRIGRNVFRAALGQPGIEFVAVNDLTSPATLAHLLKHDSILGNLKNEVTAGENFIAVDGKKIKVYAERDPAKLNWAEVGAQIVVESTGFFTDATKAKAHLGETVKKVIISAPATNEDITVVLGVNQDKYDAAKHNVISNASCTTNCLAPITKVLIKEFGLVSGIMTTIHSYTNDQVILDTPHKDLRRARAAALSMIPSSTGAAKALKLVIPETAGKLDGFAIRVPTPNVSIVDLTFISEKTTDAKAVNAALKAASEGELTGILGFEENELVSSDFKGNKLSSIVDGPLTKVVGQSVKVLSWYDNEWGYSNRVVDLIGFLVSKGL